MATFLFEMTFANVATGFLVITVIYTHGYENIALYKPTWQSLQYNAGDGRFNASNAVDGRKTNLSAWSGECVVSGLKQSSATWWVDLTSIQSIHGIRIYYRTDNTVWDASNGYTARFLGFYVYVSNTTNRLQGHLCFHDTNYTRATIPSIVNITCPVHGRYVIYFNERPQDAARAGEFYKYAHNELCEVEVYGCKKTGFYGPDCSIPCPENCRYCHIETGTCQGCKPGYQGHQCELPCSMQFYGDLCSMKCGNCSDGATCNHVNGTCTNGCNVGVYGDKCQKKCDGRRYGQDCGRSCGACLEYKQCHHINGSCHEGCDAGYEGNLCKTGSATQH
ncbi:multiple epidermal growth factor-like domains protein 10 [Saccostrea echinata]|uniref:multiple epidermal growth factor-like domains protein 10 n=1 Tax=Saccostrea echinata TaxID=191078 RepID=UPI002A82740C|nr:multiple epidermal growth factor-like domains protein 10 [Saccostrea echinata]